MCHVACLISRETKLLWYSMILVDVDKDLPPSPLSRSVESGQNGKESYATS